jgi:hypothetical protein
MTMFRRNGTLPSRTQAKKYASGSEENAPKTTVESISPAGQPTCGQLA